MEERNLILNEENIKTKIHILRGIQVILDKDLAIFYDIETRVLKQAVKRNLNRFPKDFMFELTKTETEDMVSQSVIPSKKHLGGSLPYAFTEQGIANLSSILNSEKAIEINIQIIRAFVMMRKIINSNFLFSQRLENIEIKQLINEDKFDKIFDLLENNKLEHKEGIFFDGQIFDAYIFISDLIKSANKSIVIIDNYIDESVLTLLNKRKLKVEVKIYTSHISSELKLDIKKYNSQYPKIEIIELKNCHDRFLIIDETKVYHFGASLKDLGKKWFAFSKLEKEGLKLLEMI